MAALDLLQLAMAAAALAAAVYALRRQPAASPVADPALADDGYEAYLRRHSGEIIAWGGRVLTEMEDAARYFAAMQRGGTSHSPTDTAARLAVLADVGRVFFPNTDPDAAGPPRPSAFRGTRQPIIDACVQVHDLLVAQKPQDGRMPSTKSPVLDVEKARRQFISELQMLVGPRGFSAADLETVRQPGAQGGEG